jgi:3-oxoacyl-[acyl-carrier protein] reductase
MINPLVDGKVAMVTGANHGVGAAAARALADQGARVFLTYYRDRCGYDERTLAEAGQAGVPGVEYYWSEH